MDPKRYKYRHIVLANTSATEKYTFPPRKVTTKEMLPDVDRKKHGAKLLKKLEKVERQSASLKIQRHALGLIAEDGICVSFHSGPDFELKYESLDLRKSGIELLTVQRIGSSTVASVFVPDGKLKIFLDRIEKYIHEDTEKGNPKNKKLVESIADIRKASLSSLWTDDKNLLPSKDEKFGGKCG